MTTEELLKANAVLIHEQRAEILKLKSIIENTLAKFAYEEYFCVEHTMENLPQLVELWINEAKNNEKKIKDFFVELRTLEMKYKK